MNDSWIFLLRTFSVLTILSLFLVGCTRSKYETPNYKVISSDEGVEIRDYPSMTLVSVASQRHTDDGSFMKLFRFIQGRNDHSEKIAMTTPVLVADSGTMSFILPKGVAEQNAPMPLNSDLTVHKMPTALYAALRFKGAPSTETERAATKKLLTWTVQHSIATEGGVVFAYYNPPWTPGFMRRNEVLIRLSHAQ